MGFLDKAKNVVGGSTDSLNEVLQGDMSSIVQSNAYAKFMYWGKILFWFGLLVIGAAFIYHYFFKYNKRVLIKKLKGNAVIDVYHDKGRIKKDTRGKEKLTLLKTRRTCPIPSYKYTAKIGKLDFYEIYLDEKGNLYPINDEPIIDQVTSQATSDKNINFHILSSWRLEEMKLAEEKFKKKGFLQQHMPEILVFMAMICCVAIIWITMKTIAGELNAVAGSVTRLAESVAGLK